LKYVKYSLKERIAFLTLARPEKRNALNSQFVTELKEAFDQAEKDDGVKVIVLRAEGKVFCAGADLGYLQQLQQNSFEENLDDSNHLKELYQKIYQLEKIVIAEVQGHAIAGGCGLATVCDFAFTVPEARFGYTEVKIGFVPAIVMVFLTRKIGDGRAREMLLGGNLINSKIAMQYGLVNYVVEKDSLQKEVYHFASSLISKNSADSLRFTKKMIGQVQNMSLEDALDYAAHKNAQARETEDCKRGIMAFLNKEEILW
jgi:methylglutaconyl-CoA hydratase